LLLWKCKHQLGDSLMLGCKLVAKELQDNENIDDLLSQHLWSRKNLPCLLPKVL